MFCIALHRSGTVLTTSASPALSVVTVGLTAITYDRHGNWHRTHRGRPPATSPRPISP